MDGDGMRFEGIARVPVTIRRARAGDLPALEWHGLYTPMREVIQSAFRAQERGDGAMLLADANGFPAGQAWIDFARKAHLGLATLWAVRVFPAFQRGGLGTLLMHAAERTVLAHGVTTAELGVDRDNAGVLRFYAALGYARVGTERGTFSYRTPEGRTVEVAVDQWLLRKRLVAERPRLAVR
ncbi:N-acetyltransferase family protein [Azospirillum sp.]|uniref:GNAT family N-acetyltransferase n=1 Tax=Azospirillum sp. TaxID=34012 RepID=UPI003D73093B